MEATSFSQWAANLLGYSSHTVPIGFPPPEPPISMLRCFRRAPARARKKASRDTDTLRVPKHADETETKCASGPVLNIELGGKGGRGPRTSLGASQDLLEGYESL